MTRTAVIAGVGPGLGESLARKFAAEDCQVALFARSADYIDELAADLPDPGEGLAVQTDLTEVEQIQDGFEAVREAFGPVDILVNHASAASWKGLMDVSVEEFEEAWAVNGRGAFVCSQEAVGDMLETGGGTVIFTGATSAVRSLGGAIGFTAAKFAARGMAMDIAHRRCRPESPWAAIPMTRALSPLIVRLMSTILAKALTRAGSTEGMSCIPDT